MSKVQRLGWTGWQQKGNEPRGWAAGMSRLEEERKTGSPGVADFSAVVGKMLFPPTEGHEVMPYRLRY